MLKTILLDDEPWALIYLEQLINWNEMGFQLMGSFYEPKKVLEFLRKNPIDVLFIDISMPEMNGLEFITAIHGMGLAPHIVILSGYAEFDFAQEAIRLGVLDYCLKPISTKKLMAVLEDIRQRGKPIYDISGGDGNHIHYKLKNMLAFLDQHFAEKLNIQDLSEQFEMSTSYCSKLFTKELNCSFSDYLLEKRMKEAKRLLSETTLPIKDVVERCGYSDYSHFHKVFSKYYGITAYKFRQNAS